MEFDNYTIKKLERILEELDFECNGYDWGTDEDVRFIKEVKEDKEY